MTFPRPRPAPRSGPRHRATRPSARRARAAGAAALSALLAGSALASGGAVQAAPSDGPERITGVPVGSTLDGVRIDGTAEPGARRESQDTFALESTARPSTAYQMPFRCGETWVGTTRSSHSPSTLSVDWNRTDDFNMPVVASADGTVTTARSTSSGYGRWVVVDHGAGESTLYAHLNSYGVRVGQKVTRGQELGRLGTTGNSTGPHLHYEQRRNGSVVHPWFDGKQFSFNSSLTSNNCAAPPTPKPVSTAVPLTGDLVDDAADDLIRWWPDSGRFIARGAQGGTRTLTMGKKGDRPVIGNWTGTGKANPGVFIPSERTFRLRSPEGRQNIRFGYKGNHPVVGDWNGDGKDDVGVWRPGLARFELRGPQGGMRVIEHGESDHLPFVGDWNGNGIDDVGTYDPETRTFFLRWPRGNISRIVFGPADGVPVAGDWDNDGRSEIGAWNPRSNVFWRKTD